MIKMSTPTKYSNKRKTNMYLCQICNNEISMAGLVLVSISKPIFFSVSVFIYIPDKTSRIWVLQQNYKYDNLVSTGLSSGNTR